MSLRRCENYVSNRSCVAYVKEARALVAKNHLLVGSLGGYSNRCLALNTQEYHRSRRDAREMLRLHTYRITQLVVINVS